MCVDIKVVVIKGRKLMIFLFLEIVDKVYVVVDLVLYIGEFFFLKIIIIICMLWDVGIILFKN